MVTGCKAFCLVALVVVKGGILAKNNACKKAD
jgi:hypothetical protein